MVSEARKPQAARRRRRGVLRGGGDPGEPSSVAATLAKYLPSEALAVYTPVLALLVDDHKPLADQDFGLRWVLAGVVAVLAVLYGVGAYRRAVLRAGKQFRWPLAKTLTVLIAFAAWVCVIPGSPMGSFGWYTPARGAAIGVVVNALLGAIALFTDDPATGGE
jgi:hypothetical protein